MSLEQDMNDLYDFAQRYPEGWTIYDVKYEFGWDRAKHWRVLCTLRDVLAEYGMNVYCHRKGPKIHHYVLTDDLQMQKEYHDSVWRDDMIRRMRSGVALTRSSSIAAQEQGKETTVQLFYRLRNEQRRYHYESFMAMTDVSPNGE